MNKFYLSLTLFLLLTNCIEAQEAFYGEWHMQELVMESLKERDVVTGEMLKEEGTIWVMKFSEGGKFYQKSNYNAQERMDEMDGTWKTEPNERLTIFLVINGNRRPLKFFYSFKNEKLILERYDQMRTQRMVVVFKKSS